MLVGLEVMLLVLELMLMEQEREPKDGEVLVVQQAEKHLLGP